MNYPVLYSPYDAAMWDSIAKDAMAVQKCTECGTFRYPPGASCPSCLSVHFEWNQLSGRAKTVSWATFHRQYLPAYPTPHTVVAARLEEGPILIAGIDTSQKPGLRLEAPLKVITREHPDGYKVPWFTLMTQP